MTEPNKHNAVNTALLVFARQLVDEMRYINYPNEWSRPPLKDLLPQLLQLLDHHPKQLGSIIEQAYTRTFPEPKTGNINQLNTDYPDLFDATTKDYYLDQYETQQLLKYSPDSSEPISQLQPGLKALANSIIDTFASLDAHQENEHRTLERICYALEPIYRLAIPGSDITFALIEYADTWRNLAADERKELSGKLNKSQF